MDNQIDAVLAATHHRRPPWPPSAVSMSIVRNTGSARVGAPALKAAQKHKVVTQLGNQGHSSGSIRQFCEWIWDGAIGNVHTIHAGCDQFAEVYAKAKQIESLKEKHEIPPELDWDLWLGPAADRPYHPAYLPFHWQAGRTSARACWATGSTTSWIQRSGHSIWAPRTIKAKGVKNDLDKRVDVPQRLVLR